MDYNGYPVYQLGDKTLIRLARFTQSSMAPSDKDARVKFIDCLFEDCDLRHMNWESFANCTIVGDAHLMPRHGERESAQNCIIRESTAAGSA